jgi:hypothetical protein
MTGIAQWLARKCTTQITHQNFSNNKNRRSAAWKRWRISALWFVTFIAIAYALSLAAVEIDGSFNLSLVTLPSKRTGFQQLTFSLNESDISSSFEQAHFMYANMTYSYRYSPNLLIQRKQQIDTHLQNRQQQKFPLMIFGICAAADKGRRRQAARRSWTQDAALVFFIVAGDWEEIAHEFQIQGDLLWIDTPEDYRNGLTPKTLGFIHFAATQLDQRYHLPFDYIFKADDDVYVNATHMSLELSLLAKDQSPHYYNLVKAGSKPIRKRPDSIGNGTCPEKSIPTNIFHPMLQAWDMRCLEGLPGVPRRI